MRCSPHPPRLLALALTFASLMGGLAPDVLAKPPGESEAAQIEELTRLSDAWDKAIVRKDRAAIEANMSDDFRQIDGDGDMVAKKAFVDELVSDQVTIEPYRVEEFEVRLYGDTALLSGRTRMKGIYQGKPFASHYRYIDIYVRKAGKWQIVSVQITRLKS